MTWRDATLKDPDGLLYHGGAVAYALTTHGLGFAGLFSGAWLVNAIATLLLAHGMTIAAYMLHESAHNTVFERNQDNARLGRFLTWLCGVSYGTYEDIRYKHFRHHVDVDDVVFHNAHYAEMTTPWWRLPTLHRELFGDDPEVVIPLGAQLAVFHRHRVARIVGGSADEGEDASESWGREFLKAAREGRVTGGNAASFLTSF
jgi:fatty acid desaturase